MSINDLLININHEDQKVAEVVSALEEHGVEVLHLELDAPSLDDVFAEATGRRLEGAEPSA